MKIRRLNEKFKKLFKESITLMDSANPALELGDAFLVDTKDELIAQLDKLLVTDSVAIRQGKKEITIMLQEENDYTFIIDSGIILNDRERIGVRTIPNLRKDEVLDLIDIEVK